MTTPQTQSSISLLEAARGLVTGLVSEHDAEVILAHAIEHGELHANIKRWSTEQWEGHIFFAVRSEGLLRSGADCHLEGGRQHLGFMWSSNAFAVVVPAYKFG